MTYAAGGASLTKFWLSELQACRLPLVLEQKGLSSTQHVSTPSPHTLLQKQLGTEMCSWSPNTSFL